MPLRFRVTPARNGMQIESDVLIIGSGAAGLSLALRLADTHRISLISKGVLTEGSTLHAQGGIAAVLGDDDSIEAHINDTLNAGAGLCDPEVVRFVVERSAANIRWLLESGIRFNPGADGTRFDLTREGGHSHRRIVHADDATGRALETTLEARVRAHPNIDIHEHHIAVDLITRAKLGLPGNRCLGAYVLDKEACEVRVFRAAQVVLATGGASKVYLYTSNPDTSTGDGIAMGWRAGCRVANMEFNQFHPLPPPGQELPDFGSGAWRGRAAAAAQWPELHGALRPPRRAGAPGHRRPGHRPRDEAPGHRARLSGHQPQAGRVREEAFPVAG